MSFSGGSRPSFCGEMGDNLSETESDTSSVMGDQMMSVDGAGMKPPSPAGREQLLKRIESLLQEKRVLKMELETYKLRVKTLQEDNKALRQTSVLIQAKAEQEEEYISNTLLKKIQELKKEKEALALNYEQEEECLTNDLSRKLNRLRNEKAELAQTLQQEQESLVNRLMRKITKLESETSAKQNTLDQLRREKVELENTLEQEQESLVNRLWKRMDKLEAEKRHLQKKLDQPISAPPSPMDVSNGSGVSPQSAQSSQNVNEAPATSTNASDPATMVRHIQTLRNEVVHLKTQLKFAESQHTATMHQMGTDEHQVRDENLRLRRKLEMEVERRQELCRHLSESESSLEMEDERHFNELSLHRQIPPPPASAGAAAGSHFGPTPPPMTRGRTISSPVALPLGHQRSVSPVLSGLNVNVNMAGGVYGPPSPLNRCSACGSVLQPILMTAGSVPSPSGRNDAYYNQQFGIGLQRTKSGERPVPTGERFVRPANPPTPKAADPAPSVPVKSQNNGNGEGDNAAKQ